jgi:hypothetical protein
VIGSEAAGAGLLAPYLEWAASEVPPRLSFAKASGPANYRRLLAEGSSDGPRLVFSDLLKARASACAEAVEGALAVVPWNGTRSVALLVNAQTMDWWLRFAGTGGPVSGVELLGLRRLDSLAARAWAAVYEDVFQDDASRRALLEVTGGWPFLLARAETLISNQLVHGLAPSTNQILDDLQADISEHRESIDAVLAGVLDGAPDVVCALFAQLADNPAVTLSKEDLAELAEGECEDPTAVIDGLGLLGALRVQSGTLGAEPLLAGAWARTK